MPGVSEEKPRWVDLVDSSSESLGACGADLLDSSAESAPSRLLLEDVSYESQSAGASGLSDLLHEGAAFSVDEPRKRVSVADSSPLVKKARKDATWRYDNVNTDKRKHIAADTADHEAAGSSQDLPQDKVAQLQQMGFVGTSKNMLKEQIDLMGGSMQELVKAHKAVEEQAKQCKKAAQTTEDPVKEKIVRLQQMGLDDSEHELKAKLEEKDGDLQEVVELLLQQRVEKPFSESDKRHRIISHVKERRDGEINYPYFNEKRPREKRVPIREPMTPDPKEDMSKRQWEKEMACWRDGLRKWKKEHGGA